MIHPKLRTKLKSTLRLFMLVGLLAGLLAAGGGAPAYASAPGAVTFWGTNYGGVMIPIGLSGVTAISASPQHHNLALKSDGTVAAWGINVYGQINVPGGLSGVTAVAAGGYHSLALKSDGTVVAWGDNTYGQTSIPVGLSGVTAIAAGDFFSLALKSDGTVVAWGNGFAGQTNVPVGLSGVTAIAAGAAFSLALKSDGTVVAWGLNAYGETSVPAGLSGVIAIDGGYFHSLALKSDGSVVAWGYNVYGQTSVPAGLGGVTAIAAGGYHNLALKSDGTVVAWGFNSGGQAAVPAGLNGVSAVAAGYDYSLALVSPADSTPPGAAPTQSPVANAGGWNNSDVIVAWNWTDNAGGAGIDPANCTTSSTSVGQGVLNLSASCDDLAGNTGSASYSVQVDKIKPTIVAAATTSPNAATWYSNNVTVHFSCADGGSGIPAAACPVDQVLSTEGAAVASTAQTVTDAAGNISDASNLVIVKIDKTAPALTPVVSPNPVLLNGSASVTSGAADALSGLDSQSCGALDTSTAGSKSVTCTATDIAGNTNSASVSYAVNYTFSGFMAPVSNPGVVNSGQAGRTYPLTWQLFDATNAAISNLTAITSITYKSTSCSAFTHDPAGALPANSTGGTILRYESNKYMFNWQTPQDKACYTLFLTLDSSQVLPAYFNLTK